MYLYVCNLHAELAKYHITSFVSFKTFSLCSDINQKCDTCLYWYLTPCCCRLGDSSIMGERRHKDEIDSADDSDGKGDDEVSKKYLEQQWKISGTLKNIWPSPSFLPHEIMRCSSSPARTQYFISSQMRASCDRQHGAPRAFTPRHGSRVIFYLFWESVSVNGWQIKWFLCLANSPEVRRGEIISLCSSAECEAMCNV